MFSTERMKEKEEKDGNIGIASSDTNYTLPLIGLPKTPMREYFHQISAALHREKKSTESNLKSLR